LFCPAADYPAQLFVFHVGFSPLSVWLKYTIPKPLLLYASKNNFENYITLYNKK
jgi:hypothetical protein